MIDLHVHTTASDGTCSPSDVVQRAHTLGLHAIAITDHDTVLGYEEARQAAAAFGLEVIPGIEISTRYHTAVHILGYYVNPASSAMAEVLDWIVRDRDERNERMCALMRADGLPVDYGEMKAQFGEVIGRPHFARLLVELRLAKDVQDAFRRYVEKGQKYYQGRHFLTIERSIEIIREAGGIPVLAHPFQYRLDDASLRDLISHCIGSGLGGMECFYTGYTEEQRGYLSSLAEEYGLLRTGGSDFHGANKPHISLGAAQVPDEFLIKLKEAVA